MVHIDVLFSGQSTNVVGTRHTARLIALRFVAAVNGQPSGTYEQTMAIISGSSRPISITFVMPANGGSGSGSRISGVGGGPPLVQPSWVRLDFKGFSL